MEKRIYMTIEKGEVKCRYHTRKELNKCKTKLKLNPKAYKSAQALIDSI